MIHKLLDIEHWKRRFPLSRLREEARRLVLGWKKKNPEDYPTEDAVARGIAAFQPGGAIIRKAKDLAVVEQIRDEVGATKNLGRSVRTDVFVFQAGKPQRRGATQVGGLPYWPASQPWPTASDGIRLKFLLQICFADSRDIVGRIPGDILLIFTKGEYLVDWDETDKSALSFHWVSRGRRRLVAKGQVARKDLTGPCRHGVIHRTRDYPEAQDCFDDYRQSYTLPAIEGTKIGGIPSWIQGEQDMRGRFLCAVGSDTVMWGDMGSLYIFLDERDQIDWTIQCY